MTGIVLYGPPASGKSTLTAALTALGPQFALLRKLKAGNRRGSEYQFVGGEQLKELRAAGGLLVETHRYGNIYAVDRHQVEQMAQAGQVPIVHMGNIPDIRRLVEADPWRVILLWVPRAVCEQRCRQRGDRDIAQRLTTWDETLADLEANAEAGFFHLRIRTDLQSMDAAACEIMKVFDRLEAAGHSQGACSL